MNEVNVNEVSKDEFKVEMKKEMQRRMKSRN